MNKTNQSSKVDSMPETSGENPSLLKDLKFPKQDPEDSFFDFSKRSEALEEILEHSPTYIGHFEKAYAGKSRASAMKAHCLMCTCYQRVEVKHCPNTQCPLWEYRPYQKKRNLMLNADI